MAAESVDLSNCDREPIHIPGSIQPHGGLLACDSTATIVMRHSANLPEMLGLAEPVNDQPIERLLGDRVVHDLRNALTTCSDGGPPAMMLGLAVGSRRFDVALHRYKGCVILEFEPAATGIDPLQRARLLIGRIREIDDVERLTARASRLLHGMLGYDRVMVYRFESDGSGKVVSEIRRPDLESFLGQYFPSSDIPQQARALYLRNTIRIISDAAGPRIPILPERDASGEPLDLSLAHLRSASLVHCEYLRNMGVAASMSVSVITEGRLWGLIACHHYSPRVLTMAERIAAELFGQFFSLHLASLKQRRSLASATEARRALDRFLRLASHQSEIDVVLRDSLPDFSRLMPCDGIGLWMNGRWSAHGTTPPDTAIPALARFVATVADGRVWATHALSRQHAPAEAYHDAASGLLAIPLSQIPRDYLMFFRRELIHTLDWAGNPEKSYETGPLGDRLTPRKSFAIWKETVDRQAQPWTDADRDIAEATRAATVEIVLRHTEMMAEERGKADIRQRMLNEELNHRVKNILAVIRSLVGHPVAEGRSLADYVSALKGRIQALAFAHDQVVRGDGGGLLADLLAAELGPYRGGGATVVLDGPGLWLDSRAFSVMALVLHELATNAAKYGALSTPAGRLGVSWHLGADGDARIVWRESAGPRVVPPARTGFGSALINRSIPFDLGGNSTVDYRPEGLEAVFTLPARHVSAAVSPLPRDATVAPAGDARATVPSGLSVLLVEDQMLIAMDAEAMLTEAGAGRVMTARTVAEARAQLRTGLPDVAILDVNLGAETSIPLATDLVQVGVPLVFATGYGEGSQIPATFGAVPVVHKPYDRPTLVEAIAGVVKPA